MAIAEIGLAMKIFAFIHSTLAKVGIDFELLQKKLGRGIDQTITSVGGGQIRWRIVNKTKNNFNLAVVKILRPCGKITQVNFASIEFGKLLQPQESYDVFIKPEHQELIKQDIEKDWIGDLVVYDISGNKFTMSDKERNRFLSFSN